MNPEVYLACLSPRAMWNVKEGFLCLEVLLLQSSFQQISHTNGSAVCNGVARRRAIQLSGFFWNGLGKEEEISCFSYRTRDFQLWMQNIICQVVKLQVLFYSERTMLYCFKSSSEFNRVSFFIYLSCSEKDKSFLRHFIRCFISLTGIYQGTECAPRHKEVTITF